LPDHRSQRSGRDFVGWIVECHVDKSNSSVDNATIAAMARGSVSVEHEAALLDDREELAESALQT
jgi:hypothetical protein